MDADRSVIVGGVGGTRRTGMILPRIFGHCRYPMHTFEVAKGLTENITATGLLLTY